MKNGLFRKVALERLSSPEQLDQLMRVTTPRAWLGLIGLGGLLIVILLWSIFGTIESAETGQGILIRGAGVQVVEAPKAGQVARIFVKPGDKIQQGQQVASVRPSDTNGQDQEIFVTSPQAGRVLEIRVNEGAVVESGTALVSLELVNEDLQAVLYLSPSAGKQVRPGMAVQVSPSSVHKEEFGVLLGRVVSVGDFTATVQGMLRVLGNTSLVRALAQAGAPVEVRVELIKAQTSSGYQWSSPQGPPFTVESGTFCTAAIVVAERRPISLVLGGPQ